MTREEAKVVFLNRGYVEVEGGTIYDANKWRESCRVISEWLEQEPKTGHCEDCKYFRKLPYHTDTLGKCVHYKCVHYKGFCPKGDYWYCADFEPQERGEKE